MKDAYFLQIIKRQIKIKNSEKQTRLNLKRVVKKKAHLKSLDKHETPKRELKQTCNLNLAILLNYNQAHTKSECSS